MTPQEHWIGHPTASRRLTNSGVQYQTPENQSLAVVLGVFASDKHVFHGANLWEIDGFVERLEAEADPAAVLMRERLNKVRELGKHGNWAECRPHASAINETMQRHRDVAEERHRAKVYAEIAQSRMLVETPAISSCEAAEQGGARVHRLLGRATPLAAEIEEAKKLAANSEDPNRVWTELSKLAEQKWGALVGYSSDGVQYRGKSHTATGVPDVFTFKNLRDRMGSARRRAKARTSA